MSPEDYAELMEEIPFGENHGWKRGDEGVWISLSRDKRPPAPLPTPGDHGTLTKYFNRGCRCEDCRQVAREWKRAQRAKNV